MSIPHVKEKTVLITGCSSGIGGAVATLLRSAGWRVLATARKAADLERLTSQGFTAIPLSLEDSRSVQQAATEVLAATEGRLGALVNNAGYGQAGAVEDLGRDALRQQFEVNLFGALELTRCFLPVFRKQGWGRMVHISSVSGGLVALPFFGAYAASKAALEAATDAMRIELDGSGLWVSLVQPGPIRTSFRENLVANARSSLDREDSVFAGLYRDRIAPDQVPERSGDRFARPPEEVAAKVRHALESRHPRRRYRVTAPAHLLWAMRRFAPTAVTDRFLRSMVDR